MVQHTVVYHPDWPGFGFSIPGNPPEEQVWVAFMAELQTHPRFVGGGKDIMIMRTQ